MDLSNFQSYFGMDYAANSIWEILPKKNLDLDHELGDASTCFEELGVEINWTKENGTFRLSAIFFFFHDKDYRSFNGVLPLGISAARTLYVKDVYESLGVPDRERGSLTDNDLGYVDPMISCLLPNSLQMTFDYFGEKVKMAVLGQQIK